MRSTQDEMLQELLALQQVYYDAWLASGQEAADARFLDGVRWCIRQRIQLQALDRQLPAPPEQLAIRLLMGKDLE
jgi:hypothetical protein